MEIQRTLQGETEQFHLCLYSVSDMYMYNVQLVLWIKPLEKLL